MGGPEIRAEEEVQISATLVMTSLAIDQRYRQKPPIPTRVAALLSSFKGFALKDRAKVGIPLATPAMPVPKPQI